jgi:serine/threonine protein kinase
MKWEELEKTCLMIDTLSLDQNGQQLFLKSNTHLPCDIERTSSPHGFMLTNLPGPNSKIGKGVHKIVMKALFYGPNPKIVAECISDETGAEEIAILERLRGSRGIVPYFGSIARPNNKYTIYLEYFPKGSLIKNVRAKYPFTTKQKLKIAIDSMTGVRSIHDHHLVHRDLHPGNILLRQNASGVFMAVVTDFGKTLDPQLATEQDIPQAPRNRNPPETLIKRFSTIDRYAADVYAMGCNFYTLQWKKAVPWAKLYNVYRLQTYSPESREAMHRYIVEQYEQLKNDKIGAILAKKSHGKGLKAFERFKILIFEMLSPSPEQRPSVSAVLETLKKAKALKQHSGAASKGLDFSSQTKSVQEGLWSAHPEPLRPSRSFSLR